MGREPARAGFSDGPAPRRRREAAGDADHRSRRATLADDRADAGPVENPRAEPVCEGTFTNDGPRSGRFSLSCFQGKFAGNGTYENHTGSPNDHILARGQTARGQPITMVIGLPSQLAANMYGGI